MPELTRALLDYESVSGNERTIADAVHMALSFCPHLHLTRDGDAHYRPHRVPAAARR